MIVFLVWQTDVTGVSLYGIWADREDAECARRTFQNESWVEEQQVQGGCDVCASLGCDTPSTASSPYCPDHGCNITPPESASTLLRYDGPEGGRNDG